MADLVIPGQVIGIIGGGPLARKLAIAAHQLGLEVGIFDPEDTCAAHDIAAWQIVGAFDERVKLIEFAKKCDSLLYATETLSSELLAELTLYTKIPQGLIMAEIANNRIKERLFLEESNVNIAPYKVVHLMIEVYDAVDYLGYPCVIKTARDGMLNEEVQVLEQDDDLGKCVDLLATGPCIIESLIPKTKEITVLSAYNGINKPLIFPIAEKVKINRQLSAMAGPISLPKEMEEEIYRITEILTLTLQAQGILEIEMFINDIGIIYINTLSITPTTAGHFTEYAGTTSVYEAFIKGVCGWPIKNERNPSKWLTVDVQMKEYANVLGQIPFQPDWYLSFYANNSARYPLRGTVAISYEDISEAISSIIGSQAWNV